MNLPVAAPLTPDMMPVIDLSDLRSPDTSKRRALAGAIAGACSGLGFFYIKNHGIPKSTVDEMYAAAAEFCALPLEDKLEISLLKSVSYTGYLPMLVMGDDPSLAGNLHETFQITTEFAPDDPDVLADKPLHQVNRWPSAMPALRPAMLKYLDQTADLSYALLELFALGLNLPEDAFAKYFNKPMNRLRLMHYPPQPPGEAGDNLGVRSHTDPGTVTLLSQDQSGGLEVLTPAGEWHSVPPIADTYVINIGEMLKIWTDGIFAATPHRVINRSGGDRYSVPFFANPDFDALITPLVKNPDPAPREEPWFANTESKDRPVTCGEILLRLYGRIYPSARGARFDSAATN
jgi:isopenicillin N synthase-like dioxygenase